MNRSRILTIAFSASIGLNLFFLGALVARAVHHRDGHRPRPAFMHKEDGPRGDAVHPMGPIRELVRVMGGRRDPRVAAVLKQRRARMKQRGEQMRVSHDQLIAALTREPFSEPALEQVFEEFSREMSAAQRDVEQAILELARQLTPEEREKLRGLMKNRRQRGPELH